MTIATGEPSGSTITTEPTRCSAINRATETALSCGEAVTTPAVMISLRTTARTLPAMSIERATPSGLRRTPVVPLEAGAGPDNPPCPACGEPLFGWIDSRPGLAGPVSRCESCGLGVVGRPGGAADVPAALDRLGDSGTIRIANRAGFSAWIGGAGWAGLEPGTRYLFTIESVRRLVANRDQVVARARWSPGAGIATMWQTILNGFTFGRNIALGALGRATAVPAEKPWQRRLDALICVVVTIPAFLAALPLELIAAALRRGAAVSLRRELL